MNNSVLNQEKMNSNSFKKVEVKLGQDQDQDQKLNESQENQVATSFRPKINPNAIKSISSSHLLSPKVTNSLTVSPIKCVNGNPLSASFNSISDHQSHASKSPPSSIASSTPTKSPTTTSMTLNLLRRYEQEVNELIDPNSLLCLRCPITEFEDLSQLKQHALTHCVKSVCKCQECPFQSAKEVDMKSHVMNEHDIDEDEASKHYLMIANGSKTSTQSSTSTSTNQLKSNISVPTKARKSINGPNNSWTFEGENRLLILQII
jgi:hypothetical protein